MTSLTVSRVPRTRCVRRFASGLFPLDEALVEVALDLSGRPYTVYDVPFGEVKIRATHAARANADADFARAGLRHRSLLEDQWPSAAGPVVAARNLDD